MNMITVLAYAYIMSYQYFHTMRMAICFISSNIYFLELCIDNTIYIASHARQIATLSIVLLVRYPPTYSHIKMVL